MSIANEGWPVANAPALHDVAGVTLPGIASNAALANQCRHVASGLVLTAGEAEILRMLEIGLANRDIAAQLRMAVRTREVAMSPNTVDDDVDTELVAPSELYWDDVVDVICAGVGPGVVAHAILCADLGFTVELAAVPPDLADPDTVAYLEAMTDDLGPLTGCDLEVPLVRAEPVPPQTDRSRTVEPFIGSRLRDWSAGCAVSPFGVVFSAVPEAGMAAMRTDTGETIRAAVLGPCRFSVDRPGPALVDLLAGQARERDLAGHGVALRRLVFEYGRVAGAAVETSVGTRLVRATEGVALSTAAVPAGAEWPVQPEVRDTVVGVAMVSRTGSRFGRVELIHGS